MSNTSGARTGLRRSKPLIGFVAAAVHASSIWRPSPPAIMRPRRALRAYFLALPIMRLLTGSRSSSVLLLSTIEMISYVLATLRKL